MSVPAIITWETNVDRISRYKKGFLHGYQVKSIIF